MKSTTRDDVVRVLFEFSQSCFQGIARDVEPTSAERDWLKARCRMREPVKRTEVVTWPPRTQSALYEALTDTIIFLELQPPFQFPPGQLDGSDDEQIAQPLLGALGERVGVPPF